MFQFSGSGISRTGFLAALLVVLPGIVYAAASNDALIQRITPPGSVCLIGDPCASGVTVASAGGGAMGPEQVYNTYCMACHATGVNNSPKYGDAEAWQPRIEKGIDTLYQSALNGFNNSAMPAKGLCMSCSEDEVKATVDYILSAVQ